MKQLTTHLAAALLGVLIAIFILTISLLPNAKKYISVDPQYIELTEVSEPVEYNRILEAIYLGKLYFKHPLFILKRQKGYEILSGLAERGYTPAAEMLATSYTYKAIESRAKEDTQLAKKWALTAAQQGQIAPLHALLFKTSLLEESNMNAEVKLLENMDKNTSLPWLAESLSQFYKEHGQEQKATKWATIAGQKEFKEPACTTITPWRGY